MDELKRFGDKEIEYISRAIQSGLHNEWNSIFENRFSEKIGVNYTVGVNSGTSALHCALYAAGVGPGDEVIVPPLTFGAPAFTTVMLGASPVFADVKEDTFTIDPLDIEKKITSKTKAIIPVSLYGLGADIFSIMDLAEKHHILVIEDNAQCILGRYKGKTVGSVANMATYSFQRSKHMTSECGGAVTTNDESLAESARKFSILGYRTLKAKPEQQVVTKQQVQQPGFARHEFIAPNYRLPEICAAMLAAQLEQIDYYVQKRQEVAACYAEAHKGCSWLVPQAVPEHYTNTYWTYALRLETSEKYVSWDEFKKAFIKHGGDSYYAAWQLSYLEPALKNFNYQKGICPVAEKLQPQLIQLKTNYFDQERVERQAGALKETIELFNPQ